MINGLDLFSGIGGITLALSEWVKPIAYCENDRYAQAILLKNMQSGTLPIAPIWDDIRTLRGLLLPTVDIIYGGFPCQDVSVAGARKGLDGKRTGLFREAIRLIRECRPKFVFFENVPGIRKYVPSVRGELEAIGYDCRDGFLSAAEVGARHVRNRWWLLANATSKRSRSWTNDGDTRGEAAKRTNSKCFCSVGQLADAASKRSQAHGAWQSEPCGWWQVEPSVGRVVNGIPARMDRLRGLGNAVVPQCAKEAFKILMGIHPRPI